MNRIACVLYVLLAGSCVFSGAAATDAEIAAIKALPAGYVVFGGAAGHSDYYSTFSDSVFKHTLGDTTEVLLSPGAFPVIHFTNPDIIAYAQQQSSGNRYFNIKLMNSNGGNQRIISSRLMPQVTDMVWASETKLCICSSEQTVQGYKSLQVWLLDTNGTLKEVNHNIQWVSTGNTSTSGFDGCSIVGDRIMARVMDPVPTSLTSVPGSTGEYYGGIMIGSIDQEHPETPVSWLYKTSYCGPALRHDALYGASNNTSHGGIYIYNARTGYRMAIGTGDYSDYVDLSAPGGMSSFTHYFEFSNHNDWGYVAAEHGTPTFFIVNLKTQKLTRQSWSNRSAFYGSLWIGSVTQTQVNAPQFVPAASSFTSSIKVGISCPLAGATIYYTLDGTVPTNLSTHYLDSITISATTTIKAIAYKAGLTSSTVTTKTYYKAQLRAAINPSPVTTGLHYKYYTGSYSSSTDFTTLTPAQEGNDTNISVSRVTTATSNFGVVYNGYINVPQDGMYTFVTSATSGSKLKISDTTLLASNGTGTIGLMGGKHLFNLTYYLTSGTKSLSVTINGPGITGTPAVPGSMFFRDTVVVIPQIYILAPVQNTRVNKGDSLLVKWVYRAPHEAVIFKLSTNNGVDFPLLLLSNPDRIYMTSDTMSVKVFIPSTVTETNTAMLQILDYQFQQDRYTYSDIFTISHATGIIGGRIKASAKLSTGTEKVQIYSLNGILVKTITGEASSVIRVQQKLLAPGIYTAIVSEGRRATAHRIVVVP